MRNTISSKGRSGHEPGLVSLEPLLPSLSACWTIGAFGRQRLYILSGRFGPDKTFCSRYVVFPDMQEDSPHVERWMIRALNGKQDYTKGRLDILQDWLAETPDPEGRTTHSVVLGIAEDAEQAQRECVEHAIAAGNGREVLQETTAS